MKHKTALAQLEEKLDNLWENDESFSLKLFDEINSIIESLKPIERQQIEDAVDNTVVYITGKENKLYSEIYFKENFTQD